MVRATDSKTRLLLSHLLLDADFPCRRLFLDYHGLRILNSWMTELTWEATLDLDIKIVVQDVLSVLNVPHKTMLVDSHVWQTMNAWSTVRHPSQEEYITTTSPTPTLNAVTQSTSEVISATSCKSCLDEEVQYKDCSNLNIKTGNSDSNNAPHVDCKKEGSDISSNVNQHLSGAITRPNFEPKNEFDDSYCKGQEVASILSNQNEVARSIEQGEHVQDYSKPDILPVAKAEQYQNQHTHVPHLKVDVNLTTVQNMKSELSEKIELVKQKAMTLLSAWKLLKEVFKIPRKELVKIRAEHERELDDAVRKHAHSFSCLPL